MNGKRTWQYLIFPVLENKKIKKTVIKKTDESDSDVPIEEW